MNRDRHRGCLHHTSLCQVSAQNTQGRTMPPALQNRFSEFTIQECSGVLEKYSDELGKRGTGTVRKAGSWDQKTSVSLCGDAYLLCDLSGEDQRGFPELLVQPIPAIHLLCPCCAPCSDLHLLQLHPALLGFLSQEHVITTHLNLQGRSSPVF